MKSVKPKQGICGVLIIAWMALTACEAATAQQPAANSEQRRSILRSAISAFEAGVEALPRDESAARGHFRDAALGFERLTLSGVRNASLYTNLGLTYLRLNDPGRAVLNLRRALRLAREDRALRSLELARERVSPQITPDARPSPWRWILFWRGRMSIQLLAWAAVASAFAGWALAALCLWKRASTLRLASALLISVSLIAGAAAAFELRREALRPAAVVVSGQPTLRLGRGEAYEPVLTAPLGAGVELRVLEQRADWVRVQLRDGRSGWIPAETIELVTPLDLK